MTPELETERLLLRPLQLEDAEQVQPLFSQWEVVQYLNAIVPWPYPADGAFTYYRDVALPAIANGHQWDWTLRLKQAPDQVIGAIGLVDGVKTNRGFWLGLPWHGLGLMSEAVIPTSDFWFDVLGFPRLRVHKAVSNIGSIRVSAKTGMRFIGIEDHDFVSGRQPAEIWEITADEWREFRRKLTA